VMVRDRAFNQSLYQHLEVLMQERCKLVQGSDLGEWSGWRLVRSFFVFHVLRWYPVWATWLPRHAPHLTPAEKAFAATPLTGTEPAATRTEAA